MVEVVSEQEQVARIIDPRFGEEARKPNAKYDHPYGVGAYRHERKRADEAALAKANAILATLRAGEVQEIVAATLWAQAQRKLGCPQSPLPRTRSDYRELADKLMAHPALSALAPAAGGEGL